MRPSASAAARIVKRLLGTVGARSSGLRRGTLVLDLGWMGFVRDITMAPAWTLLSRPPVVPLPMASVGAAGGDPLPQVDPAERYRGLPLLDLCLYDICVRSDRAVHDVTEDPDLPERAALSFSLARPIIDTLSAWLDVFRPLQVVYPQGYVLPAAVLRALALERGIGCIALENCFRSDRFIWDDGAGITLASPLPRRLIEAGGPIEPTDAATYFDRYRNSRHGLKAEEHRNRGGGSLPSSSGRRVLFLGQVSTDSSVLFHLAPGFRDQLGVMGQLLDHAAARSGDVMLFKGHPKEAGGPTPVGTRYSIAKYGAFLDRMRTVGERTRIGVDLEGRIDVFDAINWADLCVTINSQSGLEAACRGKPVILCGDAAYDHLPGITKVRDAAGLSAALAGPLPAADVVAAQSFFHGFCETYARPRSALALRHLISERSGLH